MDPAHAPRTPAAQAQQLITLVQATPWFMQALEAVAELGLASWCIGAGAVRNLVWDHLQGPGHSSELADVDVAYFDAQCLDMAQDQALQARLARRLPQLPWEVTNQAGVHLWFEACFGHAVAPLRSLDEAVASWPEYATAVAITLGEAGQLRVIAPWGLDDLWAMRVRRNPTRVSLQTYHQRIAQKRYAQRWPGVSVEV